MRCGPLGLLPAPSGPFSCLSLLNPGGKGRDRVGGWARRRVGAQGDPDEPLGMKTATARGVGHGSQGRGGGGGHLNSRWVGQLAWRLLGRAWPAASFCRTVASSCMDRSLSFSAPVQSLERAVDPPDVTEGTLTQKTLLAPRR